MSQVHHPITAMKDKVDYSLYLVTDSTQAILGLRDLIEVVEQALQGGSLHAARVIGILLTASINTVSVTQLTHNRSHHRPIP